jgi:hypothetical protein
LNFGVVSSRRTDAIDDAILLISHQQAARPCDRLRLAIPEAAHDLVAPWLRFHEPRGSPAESRRGRQKSAASMRGGQCVGQHRPDARTVSLFVRLDLPSDRWARSKSFPDFALSSFFDMAAF